MHIYVRYTHTHILYTRMECSAEAYKCVGSLRYEAMGGYSVSADNQTLVHCVCIALI